MSIPAAELADLYNKLASQPVIEQAKGVLMGYYRIDSETTFTVLRRWSQDGNVKVRVLAESLTQMIMQPANRDTSPEEWIRSALREQQLA